MDNSASEEHGELRVLVRIHQPGDELKGRDWERITISELSLEKYRRHDCIALVGSDGFTENQATDVIQFFKSHPNKTWKELTLLEGDGIPHLDTMLATILSLDQVERLDLASRSDRDQDDPAIFSLGTTLKFNTSLQSLSMCLDHMSRGEARSLAAGISTNGSLKSLDLNTCYGLLLFGGAGEEQEDLRDDTLLELANGISNNKCIESLNVTCRYRGMSRVIRALIGNTHLRHLTFSRGGIDHPMVPYPEFLRDEIEPNDLEELLVNNSTLRTLSIFDPGVSADLIAALSRGLLLNTTLQRVRLTCCDIGEAGAMAMADALRYNSSLKMLEIDCDENHVSVNDAGVEALLKALRDNSGLEKIVMAGTGDIASYDDTRKAFSSDLLDNATMAELMVTKPSIDHDILALISDVLRSNSTLKKVHLSSPFLSSSDIESATLELEILKENFDLEYLIIGSRFKRSLAEAVHLMNLNRAGRRLLPDTNFPLKLWPLVLERAWHIEDYLPHRKCCESKLSVLYYLLREGQIACSRSTSLKAVLSVQTKKRNR